MATTTHRFYVYAFLRLDGTPYYIGKGQGNRINRPTGRTTKLPPKDRRKVLASGLTEPEAFEYEVALISLLGRKDQGTGCLRNLTDGGEGPSGYIPSAEHRAKLSAANKGRNPSPETRAKISAAASNPSPETRAKMSAAGSNPSPETRAKLSAAHKGRIKSPETRAKMSAAGKGRKHSPEHRAKNSAARRNPSPETRARISAAAAARETAKRALREALSGQLALL